MDDFAWKPYFDLNEHSVNDLNVNSIWTYTRIHPVLWKETEKKFYTLKCFHFDLCIDLYSSVYQNISFNIYSPLFRTTLLLDEFQTPVKEIFIEFIITIRILINWIFHWFFFASVCDTYYVHKKKRRGSNTENQTIKTIYGKKWSFLLPFSSSMKIHLNTLIETTATTMIMMMAMTTGAVNVLFYSIHFFFLLHIVDEYYNKFIHSNWTILCRLFLFLGGFRLIMEKVCVCVGF